MHVSRIGFTPLKGARHREHRVVELGSDGPRGDRCFCLVDRARGRVLRTVEHPELLRTVAVWEGGVLTTTLPVGTVRGVPSATGECAEVDYWGRRVRLQVLGGPWAAAYSELVATEVVLARAGSPREVVYGAPVSLVTSSSLDRLAREVGARLDPAAFRATFTVHTGDAAPHTEDTWVGRLLRLGEAEVRVRAPLPRCAVVDLDPTTGRRTVPALRSLNRYRPGRGQVDFGVDAVVTRPGRVEIDDPVEGG